MSSNAEPEKRQVTGIDEYVAEEMERIDDEFLNGLRDRRLESGVPEEELSTDLEFVQMSGLTYRDGDAGEHQRPQTAPQASETGGESPDQASPPISFYEKGVGDVDAGMYTGASDHSEPEDEDFARNVEETSPIAELRDIIADLSRDIPEPVASEAAPEAEEPEPESMPRDMPEPETTAAEVHEETLKDAEDLQTDAPVERDAEEPDDEPEIGDYAQFVVGDVDDAEFEDYADALENGDRAEEMDQPDEQEDLRRATESAEGQRHALRDESWAEDILGAPGLAGMPDDALETEHDSEREDVADSQDVVEPEDAHGLEDEPKLDPHDEAGERTAALFEDEGTAGIAREGQPVWGDGSEGDDLAQASLEADETDQRAGLEEGAEPVAETDDARTELESAGSALPDAGLEDHEVVGDEMNDVLPEQHADAGESVGETSEHFDEGVLDPELEAQSDETVSNDEPPLAEGALQDEVVSAVPEEHLTDRDGHEADFSEGLEASDDEEVLAARDEDGDEYEPGYLPEAGENASDGEPGPPELREAEALLEELESQPRETGTQTDRDFREDGPVVERHTPVAKSPADLAAAAQRERKGHLKSAGQDSFGMTRTRPSLMRSSGERRLIRVFIIVGVLALMAAGAYQAGLFAYQQLSTPDALLAQGQRLAARGDHAAAITHYQRAADSVPEHDALRADALFGAAFSAFSAGMHEDGSRADLEQAQAFLGAFRRDFPAHTKGARAATLEGIIYLELEQPRLAIETLRTPELRLRDSGAALPILRTLARAHARLGEYDMARRAYLQAARLETNYTPDEDYYEAGQICERLAQYTEDPEAQREHLEMALQYWRYAVRTPGIDRLREEALKRRIALLEAQLAAQTPGVPTEDEAIEESAARSTGAAAPVMGGHAAAFTAGEVTRTPSRE